MSANFLVEASATQQQTVSIGPEHTVFLSTRTNQASACIFALLGFSGVVPLFFQKDPFWKPTGQHLIYCIFYDFYYVMFL